MNSLPHSISIAVGATELDNIKIIPVSDPIKTRHTITTLKFGNWEKRLINKSVKVLNEDIKESLKIDKDQKFYVYMLGDNMEKKLLTASIDLKYDIKK